jgi:Zn-dependent peptidase ImmA (M78 family)/DNA-binding XRE family transcriptional regulator
MPEFNYSRVEVARKRRGLTKTALAEAADLSTRSLTKYEKDGSQATPATIARLAKALGFPMAFFFGETLEEPSTEGSSFRALSSATARQRDQALSSGTLAMDLGGWVERRFALPEPDVPTYQDIDPETAAEAVRDAWDLGQRPIRNVVHLLEAHGVRVFSLAEECKKVDGFSIWQGEIPYIFLNTTKTAERSRMDAAHELGHLVLHAHGGPRGRGAEDEAHAFGAALLMPRATVLAEVPHGATLKQIIKAKKQWKVAAVNLARRSYKLDLITEWQYRSICIELAKRGKANEPHGMKSRETSQVLDKVFRALKAEGMSKADVAREMAIPLDELNKSLLGLLSLRAIEDDAPSMPSDPPEPLEPPRRPALRVVT